VWCHEGGFVGFTVGVAEGFLRTSFHHAVNPAKLETTTFTNGTGLASSITAG
jgi:hypothetical protein